VSLVSAVPAHQTLREDLARLVERTVVKIDNAELLTNHAGPLGVSRKLHGESTERCVLLIGRLNASLHDVVEVVVAKLSGSVGRVVGLRHGVMVVRLSLLRLIMGVANDGSLGIGSDISGRLPGVEMVVGQANKSDQEDDGAGHKDRRPVRSHLTEHCGQAILYFPTRVLFKYSDEGMKSADKDTRTRTKTRSGTRRRLGCYKKIMVVVMKKERRTVKKKEERREEQESKKRNQVLIRPEKAQGVCGRRR
jgi:hypothetical protein